MTIRPERMTSYPLESSLVGPAGNRRRAYESIPSGRNRWSPFGAQSDSNNIGGVWLQHNNPALARQHDLRVCAPKCPATGKKKPQPDHNHAFTDECVHRTAPLCDHQGTIEASLDCHLSIEPNSTCRPRNRSSGSKIKLVKMLPASVKV
jgi:hypothetical protein